MSKDNLVEIKTPESKESFSDALSDFRRQGARQIIAQAVEAELTEFLGQYQGLKVDNGYQVVVLNGYLPARSVSTGLGEVAVQVPNVR
jgi:putative transposase